MTRNFANQVTMSFGWFDPTFLLLCVIVSVTGCVECPG